MTKEDRHLKFEGNGWSGPQRKRNTPNGRRMAMKEETADVVNEIIVTPEMANSQTPFIDFVESAGRDIEIQRLKKELSAAKKEIKRWKAKADHSFKRWLGDLGWRSKHKEDPTLAELKDQLLDKWVEFKNAGE